MLTSCLVENNAPPFTKHFEISPASDLNRTKAIENKNFQKYVPLSRCHRNGLIQPQTEIYLSTNSPFFFHHLRCKMSKSKKCTKLNHYEIDEAELIEFVKHHPPMYINCNSETDDYVAGSLWEELAARLEAPGEHYFIVDNCKNDAKRVKYTFTMYR